MKTTGLIIGFLMIASGIMNSQDVKPFGRKIAEGMTNTPFGNYTIEAKDEPVMLAGEKVKSYRISYDKSPLKVIVYVDREKNCKNYVVVSESLSVMYTCNGAYFGVNRLDEKYGKEGLSTIESEVNRMNYLHQKIIARGYQDELDATKLIAAFYPDLVK